MKVCEICGCSIDGTRDGENRCPSCEDIEEASRTETVKQRRAKANCLRHERDAAMKSLGLVKVRGALGGVYWE